jgi:hypothetical protein
VYFNLHISRSEMGKFRIQFQNLFAPDFLDNVISPLLHPYQRCEFRPIFEVFSGSLHIKVLYRIFCCCSSIKPATGSFPFLYTGRFIMYSRIKKIYDTKTVGHVFTKPVQIEGTNQFFSPR